jgi:hypothetical protein
MSSEVLEQRILQHKCKNAMTESKRNYITTAKNIRAELIKRGDKFNLKLDMNFYLI